MDYCGILVLSRTIFRYAHTEAILWERGCVHDEGWRHTLSRKLKIYRYRKQGFPAHEDMDGSFCPKQRKESFYHVKKKIIICKLNRRQWGFLARAKMQGNFVFGKYISARELCEQRKFHFLEETKGIAFLEERGRACR